MRWGRQRLEHLTAAYADAEARGDVRDSTTTLTVITREFPDVGWAWYDLGLRQKWHRDWSGSRRSNQQALDLLEDPAESAEAWNLGIAATALGDWATARRAWEAFGITLRGRGAEPILMDFGPAPVRLNPEPRFQEPELLIDGVRHDTAVVWAKRLCPARARIQSVPLPGSGHRFGDVVLHDGDPVGERRLGDRVLGVFNEIALLERSPWETLATRVPRVDSDALTELAELFAEQGFAAECWTTNVHALCRACSEGPAGAQHEHDHPPADAASYTVGIGAPLDQAERLLDEWAAAADGRDRGPVEPA